MFTPGPNDFGVAHSTARVRTSFLRDTKIKIELKACLMRQSSDAAIDEVV
jgi:hypothetical protein